MKQTSDLKIKINLPVTSSKHRTMLSLSRLLATFATILVVGSVHAIITHPPNDPLAPIIQQQLQMRDQPTASVAALLASPQAQVSPGPSLTLMSQQQAAASIIPHQQQQQRQSVPYPSIPQIQQMPSQQQHSQIVSVKLPNINFFTSRSEVKKLLGIDTPIYYVANGELNSYPLGFQIPLGYNQSEIIFNWQNMDTANVNYSISLAITNMEAVDAPIINITRSGSIPRHLQVFKITLPCSGKLSAEADVQVLVNITPDTQATSAATPPSLVDTSLASANTTDAPRPPSVPATPSPPATHTLVIRRKKICVQAPVLVMEPAMPKQPSYAQAQSPTQMQLPPSTPAHQANDAPHLLPPLRANDATIGPDELENQSADFYPSTADVLSRRPTRPASSSSPQTQLSPQWPQNFKSITQQTHDQQQMVTTKPLNRNLVAVAPQLSAPNSANAAIVTALLAILGCCLVLIVCMLLCSSASAAVSALVNSTSVASSAPSSTLSSTNNVVVIGAPGPGSGPGQGHQSPADASSYMRPNDYSKPSRTKLAHPLKWAKAVVESVSCCCKSGLSRRNEHHHRQAFISSFKDPKSANSTLFSLQPPSSNQLQRHPPSSHTLINSKNSHGYFYQTNSNNNSPGNGYYASAASSQNLSSSSAYQQQQRHLHQYQPTADLLTGSYQQINLPNLNQQQTNSNNVHNLHLAQHQQPHHQTLMHPQRSQFNNQSVYHISNSGSQTTRLIWTNNSNANNNNNVKSVATNDGCFAPVTTNANANNNNNNNNNNIYMSSETGSLYQTIH